MSEGKQISILAVDDHPLIRLGLEAILGGGADMVLAGEAVNGEAAIEMYRHKRPNVVLMDLRMPGMDGVSAILAIIAEFPDAGIIALPTRRLSSPFGAAFSTSNN